MATFAPRAEKALNYNIVARVRSKPTPLSLNVKGEGYALRSAMSMEMADGALTELGAGGDNPVDFGQVRGCRPSQGWEWSGAQAELPQSGALPQMAVARPRTSCGR